MSNKLSRFIIAYKNNKKMKRKESDFKKLYDCLLDSEDLQTMYKGMTLDWDKDKDKFIKFQEELETLANIQDVDEE